MTLMEVLIASTLLVVLLTAVMVTMTLLSSISENVSTQYQEYSQIIPALGPFQSLLRAEVEPAAPNGSGLPTAGFYSVGNYSVTFYAKIGTSNNNITSLGFSAGPALIVAGEYNAAGTTAVTSASSCIVTAPCSFQVREYLPIVTAGVAQGGQSGCSFATPPTTLPNCAYPATYKLVANVSDVINNPNASFSATNPPLFTYGVSGILTTDVPYLLTTTQLTNQTGLSCTANTGVGCPLDYIQSVGVNLIVAKKGSGNNGYVENQSIVYRYAQSPGSSTYPFQYTGTWG